MNTQIMEFMNTNLLDSPTQHAYRAGKSCVSAWTEIDSFIAKHRNENMAVSMSLTDQSAAFNVLQPNILIGKLKILGFSKSACDLILNYLTNRHTRCSVNGYMSSLIKLSVGVGEGSVLGPTLYTLGQICMGIIGSMVEEKMLEDHNITVHTLSTEYADDVTGLVAAKTDEQLQLANTIMFDLYRDYFSSCGLCLNESKCSLLVIRSKPKTLTLKIDGREEETSVKLLGLVVDNRYEFVEHANHLTKVVSYKLSCLRKVAGWLTDENLKNVVESLVLSQISYCGEIYLRLLKVRNKVQKLVNSAARLCLRTNRYSNCELNMEKLKWLNTNNLYRSLLLCSFRRLLRTESAGMTVRMINDQARAGIRLRIIHLKWKRHNEFGKKSYIVMAIKTWNECKVGKEKFDDDRSFKDWIYAKTISLHGNPNH